jgi:alkaline phosphatase D
VNGGRRRFLRGSLAAGAALGLRPPRLFGQAPAIVTPESARPQIPFGTMAGDVVSDRAILWAKTDRPARLIVEYSTSELIKDLHPVIGPAALEQTGFTARVDLQGLPPGQRIFYRVSFQDLNDLRAYSEPANGSFVTAPQARKDVLFAWSGDVCGQGWGIDTARGGMRLFDAMRRVSPDFFVHVGDTIYADNPLLAEVKLDDGTLWKNVVTPAKSKVAETLDEFRGNHTYNLLDENVRRFNKEVAQVVMWDDHEVRNDWWPTQVLDDPKYQVKSVALLAARAKRAFLEHYPIRFHSDENERVYRAFPYGPSLELLALDMRSYRGANGPNRQPQRGDDSALLGEAQLEWLKSRLASSKATWKVVASDMPLGLIVPSGTVEKPCSWPRDAPPLCEAVANGASGLPLGRELEIAELLRFLKAQRVKNVLWITADVHYCAAHHYSPERAQWKDFDPFWEFVAGPAHAGTFGPGRLDDSFGPEVRFLGIPQGMKPNRPPSEGLQFFGTVRIDGRTEALSVRLHSLKGDAIYKLDLEPERG